MDMKRLLIGIAALGAGVASIEAASLANDIASDGAYDDGWTNGDNGGSGFGAWNITTDGANSGVFIGDSTTLSASNPDINTSSEAFGLFGHTGEGVTANRALSGDLSVGQTVSIQLAVNFRNGNKGFSVFDGALELFNFNVGGDDYVVGNVTTGGGSVGSTYSDDTIFTISLVQTNAGDGTWTVARTGGEASSSTGTFTGTIDSIRLYNSSTDNGDNENNLLANNLQVIPEPSTALLGGLGLLALIRRRRK